MTNFSFNWTDLLLLLSLIGVYANIKRKKICFKIWFITNACWAGVDYYTAFTTPRKELYRQAIMFTIYFGLAIYGMYEWRKEQ